MALTLHTLSQRPEVESHIDRLGELAWPRFLRQRDDLGLGEHWPDLFTKFADFQFVLREGNGHVVAAAHGVPFAWDGTPGDLPDSLGALLARAHREHASGQTPNALSSLAAFVDPEAPDGRIAPEIVGGMAALASVHRLRALVAPVRPALKATYPLAALERYVEWRGRDGTLFDPWLRAHDRVGATVVRVAPCAVRILGTVEQWEEWTGIAFPESGAYVVPGALQPVLVDRDKDEARYEDPAVWMQHAPTGAGGQA